MSTVSSEEEKSVKIRESETVGAHAITRKSFSPLMSYQQGILDRAGEGTRGSSKKGGIRHAFPRLKPTRLKRTGDDVGAERPVVKSKKENR